MISRGGPVIAHVSRSGELPHGQRTQLGMHLNDEWHADFLTVQDSLDSLDETVAGDVALLQYRRWPGFENMIAGFNRSPSLAAIVLVDQAHSDPTGAVETISRLKHCDVNPALWRQLVSVYSTMTALRASTTD